MIAEGLFTKPRKLGDHRGLRSYTGEFHGLPVSVVTTGMGGTSLGIVIPEAVRSGARVFIRVGSCSTLLRKPVPSDAIIVTAACRLDGASHQWAPSWYPAFANHYVIRALEKAAVDLVDGARRPRHYLGVEATTDCFNEGQARPNIDDEIPELQKATFEELVRLGVACYSMEAASLFVWCASHRGGLPAGAVNAVYGNRRTNAFRVAGEEFAAQIALNALLGLAQHRVFPKLVPPVK